MGFDLVLTARVLLTLCLIYLGYKVLRYSISNSFRIHDLFALASVSMFVASLIVRISYNDFNGLMHIAKPVLLYDYLRVGGVACLLCYLGVQIREDKPPINRAPVLLSFLPLLLLGVHPLVSDTIVLKETLLKMYFGGALIISILYYGLNSLKRKTLTKELFAAIIFLVAFMNFVFPALFGVAPRIIYVFIVCVGIILLSNSYKDKIMAVE